jgi:hypothetical protein
VIQLKSHIQSGLCSTPENGMLSGQVKSVGGLRGTSKSRPCFTLENAVLLGLHLAGHNVSLQPRIHSTACA